MQIYVVKSGDNVDSIAAEAGIPVSTLLWDNQIAYPYRLAVGQALLLDNERNEEPSARKRLRVSIYKPGDFGLDASLSDGSICLLLWVYDGWGPDSAHG